MPVTEQTSDLQEQIDALNRKLDFIVEELEYQKRHRLEMQDLKEDLTIVAKDLYQTAVVELEEVSDHVRPGDTVFLLKKLLRNVNNLSAAFDQLESARDFIADLTPITKEVYSSALVLMEDLDRKGYFELARKGKCLADSAVPTLVEQDIEELCENIPRLIRWMKAVTQPGTLQSLETMVVALERGEASAREDWSLFRLLREMNKPETRKGMAAMLEFIKGLGAPKGARALGPGANIVETKE
jgi:uncharacterized protein YjgD (DUF1641 family)